MKKQTPTASRIISKVRDLARGEIMVNENCIAEHSVKMQSHEKVEVYTVVIPGGIDDKDKMFTAEVVKSADGKILFSFDVIGTEDLNDFLEALN